MSPRPRSRSGRSAVAITNGAADVLAKSLALELAPIRVNAISPGVIDTGAWDALGEQGKADYFRDLTERNPARRIGTTDDIAAAVLFAMTSTFLTGTTLHIDGGRTTDLTGWRPSPGNKDHSPPARSADSWSRTRSRNGSCTPNRCVAGCGSASAAPGSPTARTSYSCTSPAATRSRTSRSTTSPPKRSHPTERSTKHRDLGTTSWYSVVGGGGPRHEQPGSTPSCRTTPSELRGRVAFAWRAMDAFYEEDERIVGHAADSLPPDRHPPDDAGTSSYGLGIRSSRTRTAPLVLYESGFAPRWYVPRADVDESALTPVEGQTFCPYKGMASYYAIGEAVARPGLTRTLGPRSGGSPAWCRSSRTRSRWNWTEYGCDSSRGRAWYRMGSTVT